MTVHLVKAEVTVTVHLIKALIELRGVAMTVRLIKEASKNTQLHALSP
jgi:hypothetical protein